MKKIFRIILGITFLSVLSIANDKFLNQSEFENKTIFINVNSYKILQFDKRIRDVQITNNENVVAEFLESKDNPLTRLKIYAKEASNESAIITFQDNSIITIGFNIIPHLKNIINMAESSFPGLKIIQINDTIFLKGSVENQKDKDKILDMFTKFDVDPEKKVVDMLSTSNPKMIRIKLYAVEINNDKGLDIKNNWTNTVRNYGVTQTGSTYSYYKPGENGTGYISSKNVNITGAMDTILANSVSLTGGLSGAANFLSNHFNTALTLRYLAEEGVANVLDESSLITLEDKEAVFKAGGEIYVRLTSDEKAELETINYGLELTLTAKEVLNDEFVHLTITTKARELDWTNAVDNIPSITNKSINTTVIIKNQATVVLGGLVNNENSKDGSKIPLLGDIPILGALFKSESYKEGKSELVFFITPEIVKAVDNDQIKEFEKNRTKMIDKYKEETKNKHLDLLNINFKKDSNSSEDKLNKIEKSSIIKKELKKEKPSPSKNLFKSKEPKMTSEQIHQKRVNEILGY